MTLSKRARAFILAAAGATLVFALGAYGGSISGSERGGFVMNYPAEGAETGGPSPRELTGMLIVPLDHGGFIKSTLQPGTIEIASHVVSNVGKVPRRIRFEADGFVDDMEWHSRDRAWNPETHEIERELAPGEAVDFGLLMTLPDPLPAKAVPVTGTISVVDVRTDEELSRLPVWFAHTGAMIGGTCCE